MRVVIGFCPTRDVDDGMPSSVARLLKPPIPTARMEVARRPAQTLDKPQRADAMTTTDADGTSLYSGAIGAAVTNQERPRS